MNKHSKQSESGPITILNTGIFNDAQFVTAALNELPADQCSMIDISATHSDKFNDDSWNEVMDKNIY